MNSTTSITDRLTPIGYDVTVDAAQLCDRRAFKHRDHPLAGYTVALSGDTDADTSEARQWSHQVWNHLVHHHLLPTIPYPITLGVGSYNETWITHVDGLTNNNEWLYPYMVTVPAATIISLYELAAADQLSPGRHEPHPEPHPIRANVIDHGLDGLIGRVVDVSIATGEFRSGTLIAIDSGFVFLRGDDDELLSAIPLASIHEITSYQLTRTETFAGTPAP